LRQSLERAFYMVLSVYQKLKPIGFILFCSLLFFACGLSVRDAKCYGSTLGLRLTPNHVKTYRQKGF